MTSFEKSPSACDAYKCEKSESHLGLQAKRYETLLDCVAGGPRVDDRIEPNDMKEDPENSIPSIDDSASIRTYDSSSFKTSFSDLYGSMRWPPENKIHYRFGLPATKKLEPFRFERIGSITSAQRSEFIDFGNLRDDISRETNDD